jgi:hypothetical protein
MAYGDRAVLCRDTVSAGQNIYVSGSLITKKDILLHDVRVASEAEQQTRGRLGAETTDLTDNENLKEFNSRDSSTHCGRCGGPLKQVTDTVKFCPTCEG